jgi:phosphate starvation-inducible protein PhoH
MASVTRVNGSTGAHGTTVSVAQLKAFEIDALVDISAKAGVESTIEAIVREFQPLMYVSTGTAGKIFMIVDGHAVDAASMQIRLRDLGTVDSIVLTSATVTERELDEFSAA